MSTLLSCPTHDPEGRGEHSVYHVGCDSCRAAAEARLRLKGAVGDFDMSVKCDRCKQMSGFVLHGVCLRCIEGLIQASERPTIPGRVEPLKQIARRISAHLADSAGVPGVDVRLTAYYHILNGLSEVVYQERQECAREAEHFGDSYTGPADQRLIGAVAEAVAAHIRSR
jgi:hypothetical protein